VEHLAEVSYAIHELVAEAYNHNMRAQANGMPKQGDKCPACGEGTLTVSPSGQHLVCPKCGRVVVLCSPTRVQS
jgi:predicted RNA-binding Zn-ribbon protein involved in translation (DUF1610 family)